MERQEIELARRLADANKARCVKGVKKLKAWLSHQRLINEFSLKVYSGHGLFKLKDMQITSV
eukprot:m.242453 g.242453  ORF g.242453 m.242453 type:complete len:62 (+) comp40219_c0_seq34:229-414(+)